MAEAAAIREPWWEKEFIICFLSLTVLSLAIDFATRGLAGQLPAPSYRRIKWFVGPISTLPIFGAAVGVRSAGLTNKATLAVRDVIEHSELHDLMMYDGLSKALATPIAHGTAENFIAYNNILVVFSALLIALGVLLGLAITIVTYAALDRFPRVSVKLAALVLLLTTALLILLFTLQVPRVILPQLVTPIGILCLFFVVLTGWITLFRALANVTGWPFISTLVCAVIVFSLFDLNDNHKVRTSTVLHQSEQPRSDAQSAFKLWINSRGDFNSYSHNRYPIYVVAAQGGGIYAAAHAAGFLASVQDDCPNFAHHVFAISGVSGGSVGAAIFAALIRQWELTHPNDSAHNIKACAADQRPGTLFTDATAQIVSRDLLSPLMASLLFPDFLQQLLFLPVPSFDRARALEYSLEQAWSDGLAINEFQPFRGSAGALTNPLKEPFLSIWKPEAGSSVPALVFNTTEVHTGYRRVVSPFTIGSPDHYLDFVPVWTDSQVGAIDPTAVLSQMPLSTAAFLSARFPWVTPAGWFDDVNTDANGKAALTKIRVVDGGYFENSGIVTAMDVVDCIIDSFNSDPEMATLKNKIEINLITLNSKEYTTSDFYGLSEVIAPVDTMLSTRNARAPIETARAQQLLSEGSAGGQANTAPSSSVTERFDRVDLDWVGYPLPLGWRLSPVTRAIIGDQLGYRDECAVKTLPELSKMASPPIACLRELLFQQLIGG